MNNLVSMREKRINRSKDKNRFLSRNRYRIKGANLNGYYHEYLTLLKIAWELKYSLEKTIKIFGDDCLTVKMYRDLLQNLNDEINELLEIANEPY